MFTLAIDNTAKCSLNILVRNVWSLEDNRATEFIKGCTPWPRCGRTKCQGNKNHAGEIGSEQCSICKHMSGLCSCTHHYWRLRVKPRPVLGECTTKTQSLVTCCDLCWSVWTHTQSSMIQQRGAWHGLPPLGDKAYTSVIEPGPICSAWLCLRVKLLSQSPVIIN